MGFLIQTRNPINIFVNYTDSVLQSDMIVFPCSNLNLIIIFESNLFSHPRESSHFGKWIVSFVLFPSKKNAWLSLYRSLLVVCKN